MKKKKENKNIINNNALGNYIFLKEFLYLHYGIDYHINQSKYNYDYAGFIYTIIVTDSSIIELFNNGQIIEYYKFSGNYNGYNMPFYLNSIIFNDDTFILMRIDKIDNDVFNSYYGLYENKNEKLVKNVTNNIHRGRAIPYSDLECCVESSKDTLCKDIHKNLHIILNGQSRT